MDFDIDDIDDTVHSRVRLGILSHLASAGESNFQHLKKLLRVTDGNLGTHLSKLESAGYVAVEKMFIGKKPFTRIILTHVGRDALMAYLNKVSELIDSISPAAGVRPSDGRDG